MDNRTLCLLYLLGEASPAETAALSVWIEQDPKHAEVFARLALQDFHLNSVVQQYCKPAQDPANLLNELAALEEASGPAQPVDLTNEVVAQQLLEKQQREEAARLEEQDARGQKERLVLVIPKAVVWIGLAAAVALAATLLFQLSDNRDAPLNIADAPSQSQPEQVVHPAFAAMVRSLDASWGTGGDNAGYLRKGSHTLTEGLVELKLLNSTQVVIEAPASFVLTGINSMDVLDGRAVVTVANDASGFRLDTPSAKLAETGWRQSTSQPRQTLGTHLDFSSRKIVRVNSTQIKRVTEFGVYVDSDAQTHVQLFSGELQATPIIDRQASSESVALTTEQSVVLAADAEPKFVENDSVVFQRQITKKLNLPDMVMGGDGTTQTQDIGLHPLTGQLIKVVKGNQSLDGLVTSGLAQPVPHSNFVAGVFIPTEDGQLDDLPAGLTLPQMPKTNGTGYSVIWSGTKMPRLSDEAFRDVPTHVPHHIAKPGDQAMVMHANSGLILDLNAVRTQYPDFEVIGVKAVVGNAASPVHAGDAKDSRSEFVVYLDDTIAMRRTFQRSAPDDERVAKIDLAILPSDRYLTLISADGGDKLYVDWNVLGDPIILLRPRANTNIDF